MEAAAAVWGGLPLLNVVDNTKAAVIRRVRDPETGKDLRKAPRSREECEAACYDCLMSYSNQQDHELLDRQRLRDLLLRLRGAKLESSPGPLSRAEHLAELERFCQSDLERRCLLRRRIEARSVGPAAARRERDRGDEQRQAPHFTATFGLMYGSRPERQL